MAKCVIIGRSPFVATVDVPRLLHHDIIGINQVGASFPCDYLFYYDHPHPYIGAPQIFGPFWCEAVTNPITPRVCDWPIMPPVYQDGILCLGFKLFTVSLALNWALVKGYKDIYLVGIDHDPTKPNFDHFDGGPDSCIHDPAAHQGIRDYAMACTKYANVYQCNPAVDWPLDYAPIETLYI